MFSIVAFSESQDPGGAYAGIAAVTDQIAHTEGDNLYVPKLSNLVGEIAFMGATNPGSPYLISPSIREKGKQYISPVIPLILPSSGLFGTAIPHVPIALTQGEGLQAYDNSDPAAAELHTVVLWLADGAITPVNKPSFTAKASASVTSSAGKWGSGTITFTDTLPVGRYAIVGAKCVANNVMAFRLVFPNASNRPGGVPVVTDTFETLEFQRRGKMGVWGEFHSLTPPTLEILGDGSAATQVLLMDLVYLGS